MILSYEPKDLPVARVHEILLGTVAPRPIAWASTVDKEGRVNLAPFSFFNVFGSNPPILVFSPNRRVRDNTSKHTLENIELTRECVINIVNYELCGQMVLSSAEYDEGVNEFIKAGLSMEPSLKVKAPRILEAPAQYECIVRDIIHTGDGGGAANLIICEVVHMHVNDHIFNEEGKIDPVKVDNVARMGGIWYSRAEKGLFQMPNPKGRSNIGFDGMPEFIIHSKFLNGWDISAMAGLPSLPTSEEVNQYKSEASALALINQYSGDQLISATHEKAKILIREGHPQEALVLLLAIGV